MKHSSHTTSSRLRETPHKGRSLKERLYIIIFESNTPMGKAFDVTLLWTIVASILLVIVESMPDISSAWKSLFTVLEYVFTFFFTLEYLCRLYCSPHPRRYALSFFGIIDLLSTLPLYLGLFFTSARYLMILRTFRLIRVFRVFKLFSFLAEGDRLLKSLRLSAHKILVFFLFVVIMTIALGTLMYMVEGNLPDTQFTDIPTSIYWAIVTMTTVGYGDIAPVTHIGRMLSAVVMLMGYTIMAVPTGIVSAQFIQDREEDSRRKGNKKRDQAKDEILCPECGCPLPPQANFCLHCGKEQNNKQLNTYEDIHQDRRQGNDLARRRGTGSKML